MEYIESCIFEVLIYAFTIVLMLVIVYGETSKNKLSPISVVPFFTSQDLIIVGHYFIRCLARSNAICIYIWSASLTTH